MLANLTPLNLLITFSVAAVIAIAAWRLASLDASGAVAATLLGGVIYGLGGLPWAILLVAFFISSSLLSRAFANRKSGLASGFAKGGRRDWAQVLANGGPAALFLVAAALGLMPASLAWLAYAAALAAVTADTWATELGVLSTAPPRLINTWQIVPRGTSGGVSFAGTSASLLGALFITFLAYLIVPLLQPFTFYAVIAVVGLFGSLVDSWIGATVQAIYFCPDCGEETEHHPLHVCGTTTLHHRGWPWLDNDLVNFIASFSAAILALFLASLFSVVA